MSILDQGLLSDNGNCFACGKDNPHGLRMRVDFDEQTAFCKIALPGHSQGWEGIAHGGVVCTLLDEVMAYAVIKFAGQAVTASMEVRYRKPVPLEKTILARGWIDHKKSRLVKTKAKIILCEDYSLLAEAEANFLLRPAGGQSS